MMKLGVLLHTGGQHIAAWRHPDGIPAAGFDMGYFQQLASTAERAKMDFLFIADVLGVRDGPMELLARSAQLTFVAEPLTLMSALSATTSNIGLVVTASTTYSHPYTVARQMASLDLISNGRGAWNIVTSTQNSEAANFGLETTLDHAERYARAAEFVEVVRGLWKTVEPGLLIGDKGSGLLFDSAKIHRFRHSRRFFDVDGTLNVPPSLQGRPLLVQAGASGPGRGLAASVADLVFAQAATIDVAQDYSWDIRERAKAAGRDPDTVKILVGLVPLLGRTREDALEKAAELDALIHPELAVTLLAEVLAIDLTAFPIDGPLPSLEGSSNKSQTAVDAIATKAREANMTIRQVATWLASSMGHHRVAGTADDVADSMQEWFEAGACDGFLISPLIYPHGLSEFADQVVPILRKRGLFRTDYESNTFRGNLLA